MPFQVIPKEHAFFDLFSQAAMNVVAAARELSALTEDLADGEAKAARIKTLEHEGDEVTHRILALLNTTFVTPFDREDIYRLASRLDDVLDAAEAVADLLVLHRVEEPLPELHQQAGVLVRTTEVVEKAVSELRSLQELNGYLVEINRLENEGDRVYRKTVARLYSGDFKAMDVLKWKDLVDQMEEAIDGCEDIANTIESMALKHA
jgi:predicted phosphate transport protein (TIGR00153 family)